MHAGLHTASDQFQVLSRPASQHLYL